MHSLKIKIPHLTYFFSFLLLYLRAEAFSQLNRHLKLASENEKWGCAHEGRTDPHPDAVVDMLCRKRGLRKDRFLHRLRKREHTPLSGFLWTLTVFQSFPLGYNSLSFTKAMWLPPPNWPCHKNKPYLIHLSPRKESPVARHGFVAMGATLRGCLAY